MSTTIPFDVLETAATEHKDALIRLKDVQKKFDEATKALSQAARREWEAYLIAKNQLNDARHACSAVKLDFMNVADAFRK